MIFTLPYFIATKWEAFKSRGVDYRSSTDFEDIVYVLEHAENLAEKVRTAPDHLKSFLKDDFEKVIDTRSFREGVSLHMADGYHDPNPDSILTPLRHSLQIEPPSHRGYFR